MSDRKTHMLKQKDIQDLLASREIISTNIKMFHAGKRELYRVIAGELRKLTCDGKSTLLPRIFPNVMMHPLQGTLSEELRKKTMLYIPAILKFDGKGGSRITSLFDIRAEIIPLEEWLNQSLFNINITIRELIRSVSDKESVHSDKEYNETLKFTKSVKLISEDIHKQHIVAIGEYILELIEGSIHKYPHVFKLHE